MSTDTSCAVRTEVVVEAAIERAFSVFTEEMETWWNPDHHLIETTEMIVEPRVGGNIIDRGPDGAECRWSRVLAIKVWPIAPGWSAEHRHLDRHGEGWEGMRDAVGSGWSNLDDFKHAAESNS